MKTLNPKYIVNSYIMPKGLKTFKRHEVDVSKLPTDELMQLNRKQEHENQLMNKARTMAFRNENAIIRGGKVVYKEIIDPPALDDYNENPQ
jgi:hypothetical protein